MMHGQKNIKPWSE